VFSQIYKKWFVDKRSAQMYLVACFMLFEI